jgi:hypothetical protein
MIEQKAASTLLRPAGFPIVKQISNREKYRMSQKDKIRGKAWLVSEKCYESLRLLAIREKIGFPLL